MYTKAKIYCCCCSTRVLAVLTTGEEVYPFNRRLKKLKFWQCTHCRNHVGCHKNSGAPLGSIASKELRVARRDIHLLLDPLWQHKGRSRTLLYRRISNEIGCEFHTAEIDNIEEARIIYQIILNLSKESNET